MDIPLHLAHLKQLHEQCKLWIDQAQKKQQRAYDKCHKDTPPLKEGDLVWISSQDISTDRLSLKLDALRYGPFRVQRVMGLLNYQIKIPAQWRIHNVFHQSKLHAVPPELIPNRENPVGPHVVAQDRDMGHINPGGGETNGRPHQQQPHQPQ